MPYRELGSITNYALWSEDFTNAVWNKRGAHTVQGNQAVAPDGATTADQITITSGNPNGTGVYDEWVGFGNGLWVGSVWLKAGTIDSVGLYIKNRNSDTIKASRNTALTGVWQRFYVSGVTDGASAGLRFEFEGNADGTFFVWGAQAEPGRVPTAYKQTTSSTVTATGPRDNHWVKDHNGIWQRALKIEDPAATNLVQYSAGPFHDSPGGFDFWDTFWTISAYENVASCVEGGTALRATSTLDGSPRLNWQTGTFSGNIEVISGIFEQGDNNVNCLIGAWGNPTGTNYLNSGYTYGTGSHYATAFGTAVIVDYGKEELGVGPNGGELIRMWVAYDTSVSGFVGESRYNQWRLDSQFSGYGDGILHHAQLETSSIEVPSSPIVTAGASGTRNWELLMLPWPHVPQVQTVYTRWTARNIQDGTNLFQMGGGGGISRLMLVNSGSGTSLSAYMWDADANPVASGADMGTLSWGTEYEAVCQLYSDASVQIHVSADGGSVVSGSRSSAPAAGMPSAWESSWVHFTAPGTSNGPMDLISFKGAKGIQTLEFMRGYDE